ncbi:ShlB/FhaC/HecB family hemolysin secretion/activation protein [Verrucomicrobiaceae bacterium 227]
MNKLLVFLTLMLPLNLWGEEIILPKLNSLDVSTASLVPVSRSGSVNFQGLSVVHQETLAKGLNQWIGKPLTTKSLDDLTEAILQHYEENDRPMNDVTVPPQEGHQGHLRINVTEGRVGSVGVSRTQFFNNDLLRKSVDLNSGDLLQTSAINAHLDWLSRNPFRRASLLVSPGENVSADLLFEIQEAKPWQFYTGYDNTGVEAVGRNRWSAGFIWGNAFDLDHLLSYRLTTGDSPDDFTAHSLSWEIPLHQQHRWINFSASYADVRARDQFAGLATQADSTSWQLALAYGMTLPRFHDWKQELRLGLEVKRADNFVLLGETSIPDSTIDIIQARADWSARGSLWGGQAQATASVIFSPGDIGSGNSSEAFSSYRTSADPTYFYTKLTGRWEKDIRQDWSLHLRGELQLASGALVPTEQLGLGGTRTIRGYAEQSFLADSGYALSAELHTPAWSLGRESKLHALTFLDHGWGWREDDHSAPFTSLGLGLRLKHQDHLTTRLDLGQSLTGSKETTVHAGISISF